MFDNVTGQFAPLDWLPCTVNEAFERIVAVLVNIRVAISDDNVPTALLYKFAVPSPKLMPVVEATPGWMKILPPREASPLVLVTVPTRIWGFVRTVKMGDEVATVRSAPATGVPVATASEPEEFRRNLVALFS